MKSGPVLERQFPGIPAQHPCFPGHFPGRPIVPGVVLLEQVIRVAEETFPGSRVAGLSEAKFLAPLFPGESFSVQLGVSGERLKFSCIAGGRTIASGMLIYVGD